MWAGLDLGRQRAILSTFAVVTVMAHANRDRLPGGGYFNPDAVQLDSHQ